MTIAQNYWYLFGGGEGFPPAAIAYRDRVEADGGTVQSLSCVPSEVWDWVDSPYNPGNPDPPIDLIQAYLDRVSADGGTALLTKAEIEARLPTDWQNASFLNIPSARKAGKLYSIIGSDFTFSRLSSAWEFNSGSSLEAIGADIAEFNSPNAGFQGVSIAGEVTNLIPNSNNILGSNWKTLGTTTPDEDTFYETDTTGPHILYTDNSSIPVLSSVLYFAVVESIGGRNMSLWDMNGGPRVTVDLITGAILSPPTLGTATVKSIGNSRWLITLSFTRVTSSLSRMGIYSSNGTSLSFKGDITKGLKVYNAGICNSANYTAQVITGASAVTRAKDLATAGSSGAQIGQVNSTVFCQFNASNFGELRTALTLDGASGSLKIQKLANDDIQVLLLNGVTTVFSVVISGGLTGLQKLAVSYSNAGYISSLNGATGASGTLVGSQPIDITDITIGADRTNTLHWNDTVASVALWKEAKDQTALNAMTA